MNFIIWLIVGGVIGWVASILMGTNKQQGILLNVIVGIVGAFVGGLVLTPFFGIATINQNNFSMGRTLLSGHHKTFPCTSPILGCNTPL